MIWYDLREEEFEGALERSGGLCVIPLGCTEKHGQHLPVGTDYYETLNIVKRAAELEDVVILPVEAWLGEVSGFHAVKDPKEARLRGCRSTRLLSRQRVPHAEAGLGRWTNCLR